MQCPKCSNILEEGRTIEFTDTLDWIGPHGSKEPFRWISLKSESQQFDIIPYRCIGCGFIEFYARESSKGIIRLKDVR